MYSRENDAVIAKMSVLFNKDAYESGLETLKDATGADLMADVDSEPVRRALRDVLVTGKVGALSVSPDYLVVEPLECKYFES